MPSFSAIVQDPVIRQLVQENLLERTFHDALFPQLLFRMEAVQAKFPGNLGDSIIFTGNGLIKPKTKPLRPGVDPNPSTFASEQWQATVQQYADTIDTQMPTSMLAIADLFTRNAHQLGMSAGQSINRVVRNRLYNAALSGSTFFEAALGDASSNSGSLSGSSSVVRVRSLNGFTTARNPNLPDGSPVRFAPVSNNNPLAITITHAAGTKAATVIAFTPDTAGDEIGPGTLTCNWSGSITINARQAVIAKDASVIVRVGGGATIDAIVTPSTAGTFFDLKTIRAAVARMRNSNVAPQGDGYYHCHLDPTSEAQVFGDAEFQRLLTSMPDYYIYAQFALGRLLGTVFLRDNETVQATTVGKTSDGYYDPSVDGDACAAEVVNHTGVELHQPIFIGQGSINEYFCDLDALVTEAGITGKTSDIAISNNGIQIAADKIKLIIRAPLDRLQQEVSTSWSFIGDWTLRTDCATGDAARYKRCVVAQHGA